MKKSGDRGMMANRTQLPKGWKWVRLGDLTTEVNDRANGSSNAEVYSVTKYDGFVRSLDYFDRQVFSRDTKNYKIVRNGDFAYATIHLDEGSLGILRDADAALISPMYTVFRVKAQMADPEFLFPLMKLPGMVNRYKRIGEGSIHRRKSISFQRLSSLHILLPPLAEQRAIAAVLDAIDGAIERTKAVIAATERLRDALLHELLTRGVPGWHSEWREASGVGTIPSCWEVVRLGEVATLQRGVDLPVQDRADGVIPVYGSNGVLGHHAEQWQDGPGVITGRSGSIGLVSYSEGPYWPLNTTLYVRDFHGNDERFIFHFLRHLRLERFAASTGVPSLNRNFVHPHIVVMPHLSEQQAISAALDGVDGAIEQARRERDGLQLLKASAADALLSGRVRVP